MPITRIHQEARFANLTEKSTDAEIRACLQIRERYGDLLDKYPHHPVVLTGTDDARCLRWQANSVVRMMTDHESSNRVDLNKLWADFLTRGLPIEDMATVYRMMGYSLCGFLEVFSEYIEGI